MLCVDASCLVPAELFVVCACACLHSKDIVFARSDDPDGKQYGLLQKINENRDTVQASVVPWTTGEDIFNRFHQFFSHLTTESAL